MDAPDTLKPLYNHLKKTLSDSGVDSPDLDARIIIEQRANYELSDIICNPDAPVLSEIKKNILSDLTERLSGKPISRIYGHAEFWGLPFRINEHTLDPRPDTELIIELALKRFDQNCDLRILDLGLGSGCILISLLKEFPNAVGYGVDVSLEACKTSYENAKFNGCEDRIHISCGSWADALKAQNNRQKFDLIVSNPPYIANQVIPTLSQEVQNHDPILSLDGGDDGLDAYKIIFSQIRDLFLPGGIGLFEIGYDQSEDVSRLSKTAGFVLRSVHHDYARNPRVVEISCGDK